MTRDAGQAPSALCRRRTGVLFAKKEGEVTMKLGAVASALVRERTPEAMQPEALFEAAHRLGLDHVELPSRGWDEAGWVERVGGLQERYGIGVELGFGDRYIQHGADQPTERFAEFIERACRPLGVKVIGTASHLHGGRWLKEPPLDEQLDRLAAALRRLAPVAEAGGVRLAIENHADYRGYELALVLERVGSPAIGARLDTGNAYCAIEEPVAAAEALARYTFATHIKDEIVEAEPGNRGVAPGLLALRGCALGEGHVDFPAILELLAKQGPLGADLVLTMEVPAASIETSIAYARSTLAAYLA
ncbi:MAG: sugar phosphate isomerase/epimerase [Chloroflexi bacterium]|nr:sugar phosphate isomerase/epimerase [Chloroflexota bacterium]